ncbi:hypothetical protein MMC19_005075 [Ptychographa xylographoides]|nr:hypothetical protein [Ptychographa xylographoides]
MPPSSRQRQSYKLNSASRNSTPRSNRSLHSTALSPSKLSPTKKPQKVLKEHPLVLVHVTLLPIPLQNYSQEILESVLPPRTLENWMLLRRTVTETMLERGILIPHPREDYELLEERLLESLELKVPRILKCGHFHLPEGEGEEEHEEVYESDQDADICDDCGRRVRDGRSGVGSGNKRWDIKIYAANGLMRAGAWSAAWREMERVDVEIGVWLDEEQKRELELRREEEFRAKALLHLEEVQHHAEPESTHSDRIREIYGADAQAYVDGFVEPPVTRKRSYTRPRQSQQNVSIWILLRNYLHLILQDRRNLAILLLSLVIMIISIGRGIPHKTTSTALDDPRINPGTSGAEQTERSILPDSILIPDHTPPKAAISRALPSISTVPSQDERTRSERLDSVVDTEGK